MIVNNFFVTLRNDTSIFNWVTDGFVMFIHATQFNLFHRTNPGKPSVQAETS